MATYENQNNISNQRKNALIADVSLLIMAIAAAFSYGYIYISDQNCS